MIGRRIPGGDTLPARLLWNDAEQRFRMPVRIVAGLAIWFLLGITLSVIIEAVVGGQSPIFDLRTSWFGILTVQTIQIVPGLILTPLTLYLAGRFLDRRYIRDFGLRIDRRWWIDLVAGFVLGGVLMTGMFLFQVALGWVTITGVLTTANTGIPAWTVPFWVGLSILAYLVGSVAEELLYRGFLLTNFAEGFQIGPIGARGAVVAGIALTSGFFAVSHATTPNSTALSTISIGLAGIFLALAYVLTGQLALPIGIHIAWNFFEGNLYGFPISGSGTTSVLQIRQAGPDLITGGAFGPEAGLLGIGAILLGMAVTVVWARYYRGNSGIDPTITVAELRG